MTNNKTNDKGWFIAITYLVLLLGIAFLMDSNDKLVHSSYEIMTQAKEKDQLISDLQETIEELDAQIKEVSATNKEYVDDLNRLRTREELYNKYEYAIYEDGYRTDLTYEEIQLGEELMVEKGYDPHLMFGSIMVECSGDREQVTPPHDATGYGQFLDSTARWVWTKLMGNDEDDYYSEIRKDGETNIKMMAEYYDYLYSVKNNTFGVIKHYSGNSTDEGAARYLARINSYTSKVGAVVN